MLNAISSSFSCSWVKVVLCLLLVGVGHVLLPPLAVDPLLCWPLFNKLMFPVFVLIWWDFETIAAATTSALESDEWLPVEFGVDEEDDEDVEEEEDDEKEEDEGTTELLFIPKLSLLEWSPLCRVGAVIKRPFEFSCLTFLKAPSWCCCCEATVWCGEPWKIHEK